MSIHARTSATGKKSFQARYRDHAGNVHAKSFPKRGDAVAWLSQNVVDLSTGTWLDPQAGKILLRDYTSTWRAGRLVRESTAEVNDWYVDALILSTFGDVPLSSISHGQVQQWLAGLTKTHAPATASKALQLLRMMLTSAIRDRRIPADPTAGVKLPTVYAPDIVPLTVEQLNKLNAAMVPIARPFIYLCGLAGLRIGEALALDFDNIDFAKRTLTVERTVVVVGRTVSFNPPKTRAGRRIVPMPTALVTELMTVRKPTGLVLAGSRGAVQRPGNFRRRQFADAVEKAGLGQCHPHRLRHTAVSLWLAAGATPVEVAARAGHSSVSVVLDRYGHLIPGAEDTVTAALDALVSADA